MEQPADDFRSLYRGRSGRLALLHVPDLDYLVLTGTGHPDGAAFADAAHALQAVSAAAHLVVKRRNGAAPRLMPLEAQWEVDDPAPVDLLAAVAFGFGDLSGDHRSWRFRAMVMQPPGIDHAAFEEAVLLARKKDLPLLDEVRFERRLGGLVAQTLHVGPQAQHAVTVAQLHRDIEAAGYRAFGPQHEIYLRDPRRTEPARLRALLRLRVEPA